MDQIKRPPILPYLGRYILLHMVTYIAVGFVFLLFQSALPESRRIALDFYEPFRPLGFMTVAGQMLRGLTFALVFYPFYNALYNDLRGRLIMFGALWGVALFGSVEPQPGSIEGIIYTTVSFTEHLYVLIAVAVQMIIFIWLFFKWETLSRKVTLPVTYEGPKKLRGYTTRFLVVHLVTYWIIGSIFYQIAGYADALEEMEIFEMWRPLENIPSVLLVFFGQIFRGMMLALLLAPFYSNYIFKKRGWLLLFLLMFGFTALGSPLFMHEFMLIEGTLMKFLKDIVIGIPEIVTQMLAFSIIFFWRQRKA